MKFCCEDMKIEVQKNEDDFYDRKTVAYEPQHRGYSIYFAGDNKHGVYVNYCPFCGTKLPLNFVDERWNIILDELGPDYLPSDDGDPPRKPLPPEFQTDKWWKKRGL